MSEGTLRGVEDLRGAERDTGQAGNLLPCEFARYGAGHPDVGLFTEQQAQEQLPERDLRLEEVQEVTNIARRLAGMILLQGRLDSNYLAVKTDTRERQAD